MCFLFDCKISKKNQIPLLSIINEKKRLFLFKEIVIFVVVNGFKVDYKAAAMGQVLPLG